jgi:hypothetical protein
LDLLRGVLASTNVDEGQRVLLGHLVVMKGLRRWIRPDSQSSVKSVPAFAFSRPDPAAQDRHGWCSKMQPLLIWMMFSNGVRPQVVDVLFWNRFLSIHQFCTAAWPCASLVPRGETRRGLRTEETGEDVVRDE